MAEVKLPQLGETVTEGTITKWFKKIGDAVAADEPLFEVSTDKVDTEVPSPVSGILTEVRAKEGDTVPVGAVIAVVGDAGAYLQAERAQVLGDQFRGARFPVAQFRVLVDVAAPGEDFAIHRRAQRGGLGAAVLRVGSGGEQ